MACKLPHGLRLRNFKMIPDRVALPGGTYQDTMRAEPFGPEVVIHGNRFAKGEIPRCTIVGDYAITEGVDKDFWDAWWQNNKDAHYCRSEMVFAFESTRDTIAKAKEGAKLRSGLEPLDQDNDPRRPKSTIPRQISDPVTASRSESEAA